MIRNKLGVLVLGMAFAFSATLAVADDNAVIKGKVEFKGDPAKFARTTLDTSKDPNCAKKVGSFDVIVNKTTPATLKNVLVSVKSGLPDKKFEVPATPAVIDQNGCEYAPHVLGAMEGQKLQIKNSDPTNHNIHFLEGKNNSEFNKTQPKQGMVDEITLKAEDAPLKVKCDVHPWMGAWVGVFKHPFFFVTDKEGTFELKGLPPGKYVVRAWHEKFGEQTMEVEVTSGQTMEKDFTFEAK